MNPKPTLVSASIDLKKVSKVEFANLYYLEWIHAVHFTGNQGRDTGKLMSLCFTMIQCN